MPAPEALEKPAREHNEQQLRAYIATVNLHYALNRVPLRQREKIRVHFLYLSEAYWPSWASLHQACLEDARMEVKLIFLEAGEADLPDFPPSARARAFLEDNGLTYVPYDAYDPYAERPHFLVYQSPYNDVYLHFARLKANFIKQAGIRPIYISYGIEYDLPSENPHLPQARLNMLHYRQYVQLFAWKIFVMHKDIREGFFRHCLAGGAHVAVCGHPKFDGYAAAKPPYLPERLARKAAGRPVLVWQAHHYVRNDDQPDEDRSYSLPFAEMRAMLSWLCGQSAVFTVVTLHPCFAADAVRHGQAASGEVENVKSAIRQSPNTDLYEGPYQPLLAAADAFVTEKSSLMLEMAFLGKPTLLLQDLKVAFKPFAADIASSFYQGETLEDVRKFVRIVEGR